MPIVRVKKTENFTTLLNNTIRDKQLSLEAVGLLVRLLSLPSNWEIRFAVLQNDNNLSRDKLRKLLTLLSDAGYVKRSRERQADGTFRWITEVYEIPNRVSDSLNNDEPETENPVVEKPPVDEPPAVNQSIYKRKKGNKEQRKKRETTTTKQNTEKRGGLLDSVELDLPDGLSEWEIQRTCELLKPAGPEAQKIVDVWSDAIANNKCKSRLGYLVGLIKRYNEGTFEPLCNVKHETPLERARRVSEEAGKILAERRNGLDALDEVDLVDWLINAPEHADKNVLNGECTRCY